MIMMMTTTTALMMMMITDGEYKMTITQLMLNIRMLEMITVDELCTRKAK